ncbi:MAG: 50S ribosomal protein L10 [Candidatus Doudnabacteria bacterium]|nr:50S ribosomal protein L10 [Candidatus Doudnabacteria bacterium]
MAKSKSQKEQDLAELTEKLKEAKSVVLSEYRGTTVKDIESFRKQMRGEQVFTKVYKVSLLRKALEANGIDASSIDYKQPVILSISQDDETTPARLVKNISKDVKTIGVLAGVLDNHLVDKVQVLALADLPSKDQLRAQVVGTINAPISGFVNVLAGNVRSILNVLNAIAAKQA